MTTEEIARRAAELDRRFQAVGDDREDFDDELSEIDRMDRSAYLAFLERRSATPYGRVFSDFRDFVIPGVLEAYARAGEAERDAIRRIFSEGRSVGIKLWSLLDERSWLLAKSRAEDKPAVLRTVLLLAVLDEEALDDYPTAMILTSAWRNAERGGLDPAAFFREAANLAGRVKLGHGRTASELLQEFEPYEYGPPKEQ